MSIIIGSARSDEKGKYSGGKAGDQKQTSAPDYKGEVSMQPFYVHKKGWIILRAKNKDHANKLAQAMERACNNPNIGYSQSDRLGIIGKNTSTTIKCNCDCSSLVRQCVAEATGKDPGNFNTSSEVSAITKTGLFDKINYNQGTPLYTGDILVTATKGHTAIVTQGDNQVTTSKPAPIQKPAANSNYANLYPQYKGSSSSIVEALRAVGEKNTSLDSRKSIAAANGIAGYKGTASQNTTLLSLLKQGRLKRG